MISTKSNRLPVLISKIQHDELLSKVVIPLMQVIGQAGRCFPTQPNPAQLTRRNSMHICGIFAVIAFEGQFHAAHHMTLDRIMVRPEKNNSSEGQSKNFRVHKS
jgi:hypothetical protein